MAGLGPGIRKETWTAVRDLTVEADAEHVERIAAHRDQVVEPRRCALRVVMGPEMPPIDAEEGGARRSGGARQQ